MAAVNSVVCSRCSGHGHRAAECVKPFFRTCTYCKQLGHLAKACPELAKKEKNEKALSDMQSESEVSTSAESEWSGKSWHSRGSRKSKSGWVAREWKPEHWQLSEGEEREARKLEKKLREISTLEGLQAEGKELDALQLQKLQRKKEIEGQDVLRKVRLGYRRAALSVLAE